MGDGFDAKLKKNGNDIRKNAAYYVAVGSLFYPTKDDPNYGAVAHPRENDPIDPELVKDIEDRFLAGENPIEYPALVWDIGPGADGKIRLLVINGCRRDKHGVVAQEKLRALGKLGPSDVLRIGVKTWTPPSKKDATNEQILAALICERLKQNTDPHKKPDSARVLSDQIRALRVLGKTDDEIKPFMPKGVGLREIEALANLDNMHPDARAQFDNGAPIGLIPVVLGAPRENQAEKAAEVIATGATSTRGVTRKANAKVKKDAGKPVMRINAQRVEKLADIFLEQHDKQNKDKPENEFDWTLYWINIGARLNSGDSAVLEEARKQLPEEARDEFDQKIGAFKGESRGRGRPRKVTVTMPVVTTEPDDDDEPDDEHEDEDDGEPNPFKDILNRPDTPDDDDDDDDENDVDEPAEED